MIKVGLTGGIGSGKTTIAKAFAAVGVPVYNCDDAAHRLTDSDERVVSALKGRFGDHIYLADGRLDRKALAGIIFQDPLALSFVNGLVHPVVAEDFGAWARHMADGGAPWVLCEAAVMVESGMDKLMDRLIVVYLPRELRITRAMARDHAPRELIEKRMSNQADPDSVLALADYIISPDDKHLVLPQIIDIDNELRVSSPCRQRERR